MAKNEKGIRFHKGKWEVSRRVNGTLYSERFEPDTDKAIMRQWWKDQKTQHGSVKAMPGTFLAAAQLYLQQVRPMPTYAQREFMIMAWVAALGARTPVARITRAMVNIVMADWLTTPTNQPDPTRTGRQLRASAATGLTPQTVLKRRAALIHLFNTLGDSFNPARGSRRPVQRFLPDERGLLMADAEKIIAAMPIWRYLRAGVRVPSVNRLRAALMLYTGFPQSVIAKIRPAHLNLDAPVPTVQAQRRLKGGGVESRIVALQVRAVEVLRELQRLHALVPFKPSPLNTSVRRAAKRAGVPLPPNFHAYDLRHTFGTELARRGVQEGRIGRLMLHTQHSTMARRYTSAANRDLDGQTMAAMSAWHPAQMAPPPGQAAPQTQPAQPAKAKAKAGRGGLRLAHSA